MAIKLENKTNVDPPSLDWPYGKIRDDDGLGNGTPVDEQIYGDFHQFFSSLLEKSGTVANGLPDNAANGFQLFQSLLDLIAGGVANEPKGIWTDGGMPVLTPDTGTATVYNVIRNRYKIFGKTCLWQFHIAMPTSGSPTSVTVSYPVGITPRFLASPLVVYGYYNYPANGTQTICKASNSGVEMKAINGMAFRNSEYSIQFFLTFELA